MTMTDSCKSAGNSVLGLLRWLPTFEGNSHGSQPHQTLATRTATLLKRRPYHRQAGGQSSIDHDSNSGGEY
ncbi:hypothetical protein ANCDUO_08652, partial [Ancylostoma duodenale]